MLFRSHPRWPIKLAVARQEFDGPAGMPQRIREQFRLPRDAGEDSYNILPALLNPDLEKPIREATVHHSGNGMFAIRQGSWKLVQGLGSGGFTAPAQIKPQPGGLEGQLYNLQDDPAEQKNLWAEHPEIVKRLTALLERYKQQGYSRPI